MEILILISLIAILVVSIFNNYKLKKMANELNELTTEVSETRTVIDSAITLIKGIKKKLDEAGTDPAKLKALSDSLNEGQDQLAAAITENTPAEDETEDTEETNG